MTFDPTSLVRENVLRLAPYSSARGEFSGSASVMLDANENSLGSPIVPDQSRYPDPQQRAVKERLAVIEGVSTSQIFVGNGSDEAIDLLYRIFCRPGIDNVILCPPTYGMYEVAANLNDAAVVRVPLTQTFDIDPERIRAAADDKTKLVFICSPNNPTANGVSREKVIALANTFSGIVVVDEAYIHFSDGPSFIRELGNCPNLVVLQTFSKAWGLAGLRVGLAYASSAIVEVLDKVKPPYNVGQPAQDLVLAALDRREAVLEKVQIIIRERELLAERLRRFPFVVRVFPSDANFLLVKTIDAAYIYRSLVRDGIVVRDRSSLEGCEGCLRITVGTPAENKRLITSLEKYEKGIIY